MRMDEGYQFGIGAFETIGVVKSKPVFLEEHVKRINSTLAFLQITQKIDGREVAGVLESHPMEYGVVKIMASAENRLYIPGPVGRLWMKRYGEEVLGIKDWPV